MLRRLTQPSPVLGFALGDSIFHGKVAGGIYMLCHGTDAKRTQLAPDLTDSVWLNRDGTTGR